VNDTRTISNNNNYYTITHIDIYTNSDEYNHTCKIGIGDLTCTFVYIMIFFLVIEVCQVSRSWSLYQSVYSAVCP